MAVHHTRVEKERQMRLLIIDTKELRTRIPVAFVNLQFREKRYFGSAEFLFIFIFYLCSKRDILKYEYKIENTKDRFSHHNNVQFHKTLFKKNNAL